MTPKPKAEETLKACCPIFEWYDRPTINGPWNPPHGAWEAGDSCPHRRTPAKDEGDKSVYTKCVLCGNLHVDHLTGAGYDCPPKPTAPADEGESIDEEADRIVNKITENLPRHILIRLVNEHEDSYEKHKVEIASLQAELDKYKSENDKFKMGASFNCSSCTTKKELAEKDLAFETLRIHEATVRDMLGCSELAGIEKDKRIEELENRTEYLEMLEASEQCPVCDGKGEYCPECCNGSVTRVFTLNFLKAKLKSAEAKISELQAEIDTLRIEKVDR